MKNSQLKQIIKKEIKKILLKEYAIQDTKFNSHLIKVLDGLQISKSEFDLIAKKIANKKFISNNNFKSLAKDNLLLINNLGVLDQNQVLKSHVLKILKINESKNKNRKFLSESLSYDENEVLDLNLLNNLSNDELIVFRDDIEKRYRQIDREINNLEKDKSVSMSEIIVKKALLKNISKFALTSTTTLITSIIYVLYKLFENMSFGGPEDKHFATGYNNIVAAVDQTTRYGNETGMNFFQYCLEFFKHLNTLFHFKLPTLSAQFTNYTTEYSPYFLITFLILVTFSSQIWMAGTEEQVERLENLPNKSEAIADLKLDLKKIGDDNVAVVDLLSKRGIRM